MKANYLKGGCAIVTKNLTNHRFEIGETIRLISKHPEDQKTWLATNEKETWSVTEDEIENESDT